MNLSRSALHAAKRRMFPRGLQRGAIERVGAILSGRAGVIWSIADQFMVSGFNFAIGILAARALGVAEFGRFAIVLIIATLLQAFHNVVLSMPMMTLAGHRPRRSDVYYWAVMAWNGILSAAAGVAAALVVLAMFGYRDGVMPWSLAAAAGAFAAGNNLHYVLRRILFAQGTGGLAFALDAVRYLAAAIGLAVLLRQGHASSDGVVWVTAMAAVASFLALIPTLPRARISLRLMERVLARHWPFARWLLPMTALTLLHEQAIFVGVGVLLGDTATGALRAGQYLLGITHFLTMAMENFVPTGAARAFKSGGKPSLVKYLTTQMLLFGSVIGALILMIAVFAAWSLSTAFGPAYAEYAPVLRIYALSYCCIFIRDVWTHYFRAIERTDVILRAFGYSFVACAVLFFPAIESLGVVGAALIIFVAHAVSMGYMLWRVRTDALGHGSGP